MSSSQTVQSLIRCHHWCPPLIPSTLKRRFCAQMQQSAPLIISGRNLADKVLQSIPDDVSHFKRAFHRTPGLAVVMVKYRSDSMVYTQLKSKKAKELGILSFDYYLNEEDTTKQSLLRLIDDLNANEDIDGILLQLPLPPSLSEYSNEIIDRISPFKDIDGLTAQSQGILAKYGRSLIADGVHRIKYGEIDNTNYRRYVNFACTPLAVIHILEYLESVDCDRYRIESKNVVVIGRSTLVGTPLSIMLTAKNATVTLCHSFSDRIGGNLKQHCQRADVIVVAAGRPNLIPAPFVRPGVLLTVFETARNFQYEQWPWI